MNNWREGRSLVLGNIASEHHQTNEDESNNNVPDEKKKLLKIKLCSRNLIEVINARAVSLVRYSGAFLKTEELWQVDQRTRKLMRYAQGFTSERRQRLTFCVKQKEKNEIIHRHERMCRWIDKRYREIH